MKRQTLDALKPIAEKVYGENNLEDIELDLTDVYVSGYQKGWKDCEKKILKIIKREKA